MTTLPAGLYGWLDVFARNSFLRDLPDEEAIAIMREVEEICKVDCQDESGKWAMVYMRLRFHAVLES